MENFIDKYVENTPNAGRFIESLRNTGYNNISAIADLVDNSLDADANHIWLSVEPAPGDFRIIIADDGNGMDLHTLDQAMRLGSDTDRNADSDLGKFGMGLITASISMARKLTVISRQNGETFTAIQDLDEIAAEGVFIKTLRPSNDEELATFDLETEKASRGTVIILEKCDRLQNKNINEFCKRISTELGQIFRKFLSSREIFVRGTKISEVDPLWSKHEETEEYSNETFTVQNGDTTENVKVVINAIPEFDQQTNTRYGINQKNQGFYLMRNNREIASGEDLGIFTKHNDLNRLRMEIYFSANLDNEMGVNFTKRDIKPTKSILDKISRITYPQISSFRKRIKSQKAVKGTQDIDHDSAAKNISNKSNILINPKATYTPRVRTGEHPGSRTPTGEGPEHGGQGAEKGPMSKLNCVFELRANGQSGNLFDMEQRGKQVIVYYNIEHPFYQDFIAANKDNKDIVNTIDYLIYSLASAQLINQNRENQGIFDNFNSVFSSNLRTLINQE